MTTTKFSLFLHFYKKNQVRRERKIETEREKEKERKKERKKERERERERERENLSLTSKIWHYFCHFSTT